MRVKRTIQSMAAVCGLAILVAGCVTTGPTGKVSQPDSAEAARLNLDLGVSYLKQGKFEEALAKLQKSIDAQEDNPGAYRVMAYVYERLGDSARAETNYRKAVRYGPDDQAALNALAVFLCRNSASPAQALPYFDRAIDVPQYQFRNEIYTNAGTCAKDFDLEAAERYLRGALQIDPAYAEALYQMADVSFRADNYLQARAFIERRLAAADATRRALLLAQRIETALGDTAAAEAYGARLREQSPDGAQTRQIPD